MYKYGGQPFVRDYLSTNHGGSFERTFGAKTGQAMMHSLAGRYVNRVGLAITLTYLQYHWYW